MYLTLGIVTLNPVLCRRYIRVVIEKQTRTNLFVCIACVLIVRITNYHSGYREVCRKKFYASIFSRPKDSAKKRRPSKERFLLVNLVTQAYPGGTNEFLQLSTCREHLPPIKKISSGLSRHTTMSRTIASSQINPFSGPRFSIDWKKKFASVLVRSKDLGGFEYDRFPINKDSRDNGARSSTWKARTRAVRRRARAGVGGWASYL